MALSLVRVTPPEPDDPTAKFATISQGLEEMDRLAAAVKADWSAAGEEEYFAFCRALGQRVRDEELAKLRASGE